MEFNKNKLTEYRKIVYGNTEMDSNIREITE
jgi:hypothetical protein